MYVYLSLLCDVRILHYADIDVIERLTVIDMPCCVSTMMLHYTVTW